jgi:hypothetical protein
MSEMSERARSSSVFPLLGDARMRRQTLRWIGEELTEPTPGILDALAAALVDQDWEVRATAMFVAVRVRARRLRSRVNETALPSPHQFGLTELDVRLLIAARERCVELLDDTTLAPNADVRPLLGLSDGVPRTEAELLLHALVTPTPLEDPLPSVLPSGIEANGRHCSLGGAVDLTRVSALPHLIGEPPDCVSFTPRAFFITRRPVTEQDAERVGVPLPPMREPLDESLAERLAATPDAPIVAAFDDAVAIAQAIASKLGAAASLPTADELECAARGADGRRYSWGNGVERLNGTERSPHGLERFGVPVAQWTTTRGASNLPLTMGGPESARCSARIESSNVAAIRLVIPLAAGSPR